MLMEGAAVPNFANVILLHSLLYIQDPTWNIRVYICSIQKQVIAITLLVESEKSCPC